MGPQAPGQWVQLELPAPTLIGRIELHLGTRPARAASKLRLWVNAEGGAWREVQAVSGRAPVEQQGGVRPLSDMLLFEPVRVTRIRLVQDGSSEKRWGIAELRVDGPRDEPGGGK